MCNGCDSDIQDVEGIRYGCAGVIWMQCGYLGCGGEWGCDMDMQDFTRTLIYLNF